ncbi:sialidase-3 isoform X3 [Corvus kubaryi]|uniref:sialidase-3 isoform X3 n=1 Tax=Corvus kubaryi TaxID=68294 RepID=UPI001C04F4B4|nr:sialidase-3 isoform X3 [Corvus kubaryi]
MSQATTCLKQQGDGGESPPPLPPPPGSPHVFPRETLFRQAGGVTYRIPALLYVPPDDSFLAFAEKRSSARDEDAKYLVLRRGRRHGSSVKERHRLPLLHLRGAGKDGAMPDPERLQRRAPLLRHQRRRRPRLDRAAGRDGRSHRCRPVPVGHLRRGAGPRGTAGLGAAGGAGLHLLRARVPVRGRAAAVLHPAAFPRLLQRRRRAPLAQGCPAGRRADGRVPGGRNPRRPAAPAVLQRPCAAGLPGRGAQLGPRAALRAAGAVRGAGRAAAGLPGQRGQLRRARPRRPGAHLATVLPPHRPAPPARFGPLCQPLAAGRGGLAAPVAAAHGAGRLFRPGRLPRRRFWVLVRVRRQQRLRGNRLLPLHPGPLWRSERHGFLK